MKRSTLVKYALGIVASAALLGATEVRANNTTHSLLGIDVSSYQGSINWTSVHGDGVAFAFARATEGTASVDSDFSANNSHGKSAGLQMGAYHFAYPAEGCPSVQASHFWATAGGSINSNDGKTVFPMVDCEEFTGVGCSEGTYTTWYNDWSADLKTHTSLTLRPVIYVSACNACNLNTGISGLGAWIADYNGGNLYTGNPWTTCCSCDRWGSTS
ncbi:MAG: glycoside hydrolase family 25 protein, partial [Limisphaerales bacterium]